MKGLKRTSIAMIAVMLIVMCCGFTASAADSYSLTVKMQYTDEDGTTGSIPYADVSIYMVASAEVEGTGAIFTPIEGFDIGEDYSSMNASEQNDVAKKLADKADVRGLEGIRATADDNGLIKFEGLESGMYLVKLNGYDQSFVGYRDMEPFLAVVPAVDPEGELITDVSVIPKIAITKAGIVTADPPVEKIVKGNPSREGTFRFRMKAENPENPMPEGSRDGIKTATIKGEGETEFGVCVYTEPGTYKYKVTEVDTGEKGYTYDRTIYTIKCVVTEKDGELALSRTVTDQNGNEVDHAVFTNVYSILQVVKTGDSTGIVVLLVIMMLSAAGFMTVVRIKRKHESEV